MTPFCVFIPLVNLGKQFEKVDFEFRKAFSLSFTVIFCIELLAVPVLSLLYTLVSL